MVGGGGVATVFDLNDEKQHDSNLCFDLFRMLCNTTNNFLLLISLVTRQPSKKDKLKYIIDQAHPFITCMKVITTEVDQTLVCILIRMNMSEKQL